jgi:uncharacterized lipoprotein YehR (DUF1307 family)
MQKQKKMKTKHFSLISLIFLVGCNPIKSYKEKEVKSYSLNASNTDNNVKYGKGIVSSNFNGDKVLVLFQNKKIFINDVKNIIDTLNQEYTYKIITKKDSIKIYSDIKLIEKVLVIQ